MSENTVLSKEELTNKFVTEFYLGFSDFKRKFLENIYKIKTQDEHQKFAKPIIMLWIIPLLGKIMTMDNKAERLLVEFYIITFFLQYGAQIIQIIFSKYFDNLNKKLPGSFSSEHSNSIKLRELDKRIWNLEVKVTMKEQIIKKGKVKISHQKEKINSLMQKLKKLEDDLLERIRLLHKKKEIKKNHKK
jgi:uncharacterized coiled-coil protein SlyX